MALSDEAKLQRGRRWMKRSFFIALILGFSMLFFAKEPIVRWIVVYVVFFVSFCILAIINSMINGVSRGSSYTWNEDSKRFESSSSNYPCTADIASHNTYTDPSYKGLTGNSFTHYDSSRY